MIKLSDMHLTEYDIRQINLMRKKLSLFILNKLSLGHLIDDLEALLSCLQSVDIAWKESFHEYCFILEQIHAVALDRNEPILHDDTDLLETIQQLKVLLNN